MSAQNMQAINFGNSSAEAESEDPSLLWEGYYDLDRNYEQLKSKEILFLVLGLKGTGKTTLARRLELEGHGSYNLFVDLIDLDGMSFKPLSRIGSYADDESARIRTAWRWLLTIRLFRLFLGDQGSTPTAEGLDIILGISKVLDELGLTEATPLNRMIKVSSKKTFGADLKGLKAIVESDYDQGDWDLDDACTAVLNAITYFVSESRFIIILDGLDQLPVSKALQNRSAAELVKQVRRTNEELRSLGLDAKVVVLMRPDHFAALDDPNTTKLSEDFSIRLSWRHERGLASSPLVDLVDLRIARAGLKIRLEDILPITDTGRNPVEDILEHTRHRPRDLLMLMRRIQTETHGEWPTIPEIAAAKKMYAIDYFIPEVRNEVSGTVSGADFLMMLNAFQAAGATRISPSDMNASWREVGGKSNEEWHSIAAALFKAGALGTHEVTSTKKAKTRFQYRHDFASFAPNKSVVLHNALRTALDL